MSNRVFWRTDLPFPTVDREDLKKAWNLYQELSPSRKLSDLPFSESISCRLSLLSEWKGAGNELSEAEMVGVGFDVPAYVAPKCSKASSVPELDVAA